MRGNAWPIVFAAVALAILMVNAKEKSNDGKIHRDNDGVELNSGSLISSESIDSKTKKKFFKKPVFSKANRKTRETSDIDFKQEVESESPSPSVHDSPLSVASSNYNEDDRTITTTLSSPLENYLESNYATSETPDVDDAQNTATEEKSDFTSLITDYLESSVVKDGEDASSTSKFMDNDEVQYSTAAPDEYIEGRGMSDIQASEQDEHQEFDTTLPPYPDELEESQQSNVEGSSIPSIVSSSERESDAIDNLEANDTSIGNLDVSSSAVPDTADEKTASSEAGVEADANTQSEETTDAYVDDVLTSEVISANEDRDEATEDAENDPTDAPFDETTTREPAITTSTQNPIDKYSYIVYDESKIPCILASMSITLRVTFTTKHNKTRTKSIQVPRALSVSGTCCKVGDSTMVLSWPVPQNSSESRLQENSITFTIKRDDSHFYVDNVQISLLPDDENMPNAKDQELRGNSVSDLKLFSASLKNGAHVCRLMTEVTCGQIVVLIKDVSLVAYNDRENLSDREVERCSLPRSISIAAIVGGIVGLTVTIGIVTSYVWYRKRTSTFRSELP